MNDGALDEVAEGDVGDVPDAESFVLHDLHVVGGARVVPVRPQGAPKVAPGLARPQQHRGKNATILNFRRF